MTILWEENRNLFGLELSSDGRNHINLLVMAQRHAEGAESAFARTYDGEEVFGMSKSYNDLEDAFECLLKALDQHLNGHFRTKHGLRKSFQRLPSKWQNLLMGSTKSHGLTPDALFMVFEQLPDLRYFGVGTDMRNRGQKHYYGSRSPENLLRIFKSWFELAAADIFLNWESGRIVSLQTPVMTISATDIASGKTVDVNHQTGVIFTSENELWLTPKQPESVRYLWAELSVAGHVVDRKQINWEPGANVELHATPDQWLVLELVEVNGMQLAPTIKKGSDTLPEETRVSLLTTPRELR